jgi:hypothetical protein
LNAKEVVCFSDGTEALGLPNENPADTDPPSVAFEDFVVEADVELSVSEALELAVPFGLSDEVFAAPKLNAFSVPSALGVFGVAAVDAVDAVVEEPNENPPELARPDDDSTDVDDVAIEPGGGDKVVVFFFSASFSNSFIWFAVSENQIRYQII